MIRRVRLISVCILILAMLAAMAGGCSLRQPAAPVLPIPEEIPVQNESQKALNTYIIDAVLDPDNKTLTAEQKVTYVNNEDVELNELYFHVYTNAFRKQETAPFLFDDFSRAYPRGFQPGYTEITAVEQLNGQKRSSVNFSLQGEGETILRVKLAEPLQPRKSIDLGFKYKVVIPPAGERFGYGESNINMGNWYPVAAVYDDEGWNLDKYYSIGDPFYSDTADYVITIKAPKDYTIAASGQLVEEKAEGGQKSWRFEAKRMRDFAFIAGNKLRIAEAMAGDTLVRSYYNEGHELKGKQALEFGKKSIEIFNRAFGKYPYPTYSIVETEFPSGMEYPGLVYINTLYYNNDFGGDSLLITTVHETAHQWWYAVVGNDQIDEAWLDESFATYSEGVYIEMEYGRDNGKMYYDYLAETAKQDLKAKAYDGVILKSLSRYANWDDYGPAVYTGGAALLGEIRKQVGDEAFFKVIQQYYKEFSFEIASTEDFLRVCEEVTGKEFDELFDKHLSSAK